MLVAYGLVGRPSGHLGNYILEVNRRHMNGKSGQSGQSCISFSEADQVPVRDRISQVLGQYLGHLQSPELIPSRQVIEGIALKAKEPDVEKKSDEIVALKIGGEPLSKMTQEQIAVAVARDMSGRNRLTATKRYHLQNTFYMSIRNMVFDLSNKYADTCPDKADDLAQDCMLRIMSNLWKFDPKKSKFSTWSWHVCRNLLTRRYHVGKRMKGVIVDRLRISNESHDGRLDPYENLPERPIAGVQYHECPGVLALEIEDAIRKLARKHPKNKHLVFEMLGNPDSDDFIMHTSISVTDAAKTAGVEYGKAYLFYSRVVRPFFRKHFAR